ncbi:MAG: lipoyl synthase, partial [Pseudomonadota bacterium]
MTAPTRSLIAKPTKNEAPSPKPQLRKPSWIRVKAPMSREFAETKKLMRRLK